MIFYTYLWLRENGTPYYVGKGCENRGFISDGHVVHRPVDDNRIVIEYHSSEEEAFQAEIFLISYYGRIDLGSGCLRNKCDGGEGVSGYEFQIRNRVGERYGKLVVVERAHKTFNSGIYWKCLCDCGNTSLVSVGQLTHKQWGTKSCGCLTKSPHPTAKGRRFKFITDGTKVSNISLDAPVPEGWKLGKGKPSWNHGIRKYQLEGKKIDRWSIISKVIGKGWFCRCDCGAERVIPTENLVSKTHSKSCGCWNIEAQKLRWRKKKNESCGKVGLKNKMPQFIRTSM